MPQTPSNSELCIKPFNELSLDELYDIMALRVEVFVVEQDCLYQDLDGRDKRSVHVFLVRDGQVDACARIIPALGDEPLKIGRVVTRASARKLGLGRVVMTAAIDYVREHYDVDRIEMSAQVQAMPFYEGLGFVAHGESYPEDGIPSIAMTLML